VVDSGIGCSDLLHLLGDDEVLIIDCRGEEGWSRVDRHIPGALRMSLQDVLEFAGSLPDDELIVLCGEDNANRECLRVARWLRLQGFDAVALEGGLEQWLHFGFPTDRHEGENQPEY
jgi:rhodanese-related sulfurtransferase